MPAPALPIPQTPTQTCVVLVGTASTVAALWAASAESGGTIDGRPVACVLLDGDAEARSAGGLPPVLGGPDALIEHHALVGVGLAILALPPEAERSRALARLRTGLTALGIPHRVAPTLADLVQTGEPQPITGPTRASALPASGLPVKLDFAALIGRTHHALDPEACGRILRGKRVLITGAGGSIGSELARAVARFEPERLILMERAENALFSIDHELGRRCPGVPRRALLHDVVDAEGTLRLLVEERPHVVFHAAAHKHVPLMEEHPSHAVDNNLFGTKAIADAAVAVGAERFVMISSDKAVNPTSVMGATKRLAEIYVAGLARSLGAAGSGEGPVRTRLSMVRFGNVLGSACSVVPIWQAQLAEGGPVTVTDPRMTRYFMTIPEAATLVVQAAAMTDDPRSAPVFVLDMGEPVRILDLARRLVEMHGFTPVMPHGLGPPALERPDRPSIPVVVTGIRPGEKLEEQLAYAAENLAPTSHPGITCWRGGPEGTNGFADPARVAADLTPYRRSGDRDAVLAAIRRHVPEMRPPAPPAPPAPPVPPASPASSAAAIGA